ncbi:MAG: reverse transcriptase/maturase family protein [bacterium]|nr:reverse transcriptase/maturase family protein [bacterium]
MKIQLIHKLEDVISVENLLEAWKEFISGKKNKKDVQEFSLRLMDNIFDLHFDLVNLTYKHSQYQAFKINDPKPRKIHKATVKDRVLHHAIFRALYPVFDETFIADSYSCRDYKGTHKAVNRLRKFAFKISQNNTQNCFVLQCDIKKFFDSIDHKILLALLKKKIKDEKVLWLLSEIISSFSVSPGIGLPLGNITSQLFANIYLNQFDQFIKHKLRLKYYIRYCDDFIILSETEKFLTDLIPQISNFLKENLKLNLHQEKTKIKKYYQGVDFLGYVSFPRYRILRVKTKKRMFSKLKAKKEQMEAGELSKKSFNQILQSYLGILKHCNGYNLRKAVIARGDVF